MYVFMYVCVCICIINALYALYFFSVILFLCVYIDLALAVFLLYAILFQTFLLLNFTLNGHLSRLTPHGHLQVACTLFFVKSLTFTPTDVIFLVLNKYCC